VGNETKKISLRLPEKLLEEVKEIADRKATPYGVLIRQWIAERVEKESR
jgi:predicted DNA binding CopG/RHH family protein